MAVEPSRKELEFDASRLFNIAAWEGIQYKVAKDLGIAIKVVSEDGNISTEESNFSEFYRFLLSTPKGQKYVDKCANSFNKNDRFVNLYADCFYYNTSTYFYGKKFYILVGIKNRTPNPSLVKKLSDELDLDYNRLLDAYNAIPMFNEERLVSLADFIVDLFNIVVELSVQQYTIEVANRQKEEEIAKMSALMEASIIINSTRNQKELLKIIMQSAEKVMQAEASSVFLIDNEKNELYFEVATGPKEEELKKIRLKMGEGIAGWVAYTGEALLVPDVSKDPRFAPRVDAQTKFKTRSVICVPLKVRNQIIGVVQVLNKISGQSFSKSEIKFLEALASQAAIAIENANLYEHLEERAEQLNKELKEANINLSIEKLRIESIIQSMEDAVIAIDKENKIVLVNRIAEKIFNINASHVVGMDITNLNVNQTVINNFRLVLDSKITIKNEVKLHFGNKERIFAAVFTPIVGEKKEDAGSVAVFRDITEIKELDKMKSEFLNMVSHELRTPLTPIQAYSELMLIRNMDGEKVKSYAEIINKETQRLGALIGDLLDLSRIESGKGLSLTLEEVDFISFLREIYEMYKNTSPKHKIILTVPEKIEKILIDKNKMSQVMINLLSNAIKYSPNGGNIDIILADKNDKIYVTVKDDGIGIGKEDLTRIFEKFYRVQSEQVRKISGTGIGLPIVKYIIELHNGNIEAKSELGKGSEFTFYIPKIKQD